MYTKKLLRLPEVMERVGIRAKATIYRWIKAGTFPLPVALGPRLRAWRAADIEDWLDNRPQVDPGVMPGAENPAKP